MATMTELRISLHPDIYDRMTEASMEMRLSVSEIARRCIRRFRSSGLGVADLKKSEPTTRRERVVATIFTPDELIDGMDADAIKRAIKWALDTGRPQRKRKPFITSLKPGIDYIIEEV